MHEHGTTAAKKALPRVGASAFYDTENPIDAKSQDPRRCEKNKKDKKSETRADRRLRPDCVKA